MFYEINAARSSKRPVNMRWFTSLDMDLYLWFRDGVPVRFQLSYDKPENESVIFWSDFDFRTYRVECGDYVHNPVACSDIQRIARNFLASSEYIDTGISDFIYARLMECPQQCANEHAWQANRRPAVSTDPEPA